MADWTPEEQLAVDIAFALKKVKAVGPFLVVTTNNGVNVDLMNADGNIAPQHYASSSANQSSTKSLVGFADGRFPTGPILRKRKRVRSIITTAGAVSISRIPTGTS
jgi:hypothetical protein